MVSMETKSSFSVVVCVKMSIISRNLFGVLFARGNLEQKYNFSIDET